MWRNTFGFMRRNLKLACSFPHGLLISLTVEVLPVSLDRRHVMTLIASLVVQVYWRHSVARALLLLNAVQHWRLVRWVGRGGGEAV